MRPVFVPQFRPTTTSSGASLSRRGHPEDFRHYDELIQRAVNATASGTTLTFREHLLANERFDEATIQTLRALSPEPLTASHAVLAGIISSPIDVDKVAYLIDDSTMSGVRYGLGMDLDALLAALRPPLEGDAQAGRPVIAIDDKGLPAAEAIVLARLWMLKRVYWHHTSRATMAMYKFVIRELLLESKAMTMEGYFEEMLFQDALAATNDLSSRFSQAADEGRLRSKDKIAGGGYRNPLEGILGANRNLYKRLITIAFRPGDEKHAELLERLMKLTPPQLDEIAQDATKIISKRLDGGTLLTGDVLVDVPRKRRNRLGPATVWVYRNRTATEGRRIEDVSPIFNAVNPEFSQHLMKFRLFVHPAVAMELRHQGREQEIVSLSSDDLTSRFGA